MKSFFLYPRILSPFVLLILLLSSCKEAKPVLPKEEKQEIVPLIHHEAYIVMVDNLRMRDSAGLKSKVLSKLSEGTIILSDGSQSDFTDQITLRGVKYDAPYQKIYLKNEEEKVGWVYRGALLKIFHDDKQYPFSNHLDVLIRSLLKKDYSSVEDLVQLVASLSKENASSPAWNDVLFVIGKHIIESYLLENVGEGESSSLSWTKEVYQDIVNREYDYGNSSEGRSVQLAGMRYSTREGMVEMKVDPVQLAKNIGGPFTKVVQDYLEIEQRKGLQEITSDAAIVAPVSTLIDIFLLQSNFLKDYTNYEILWSEVEADHQLYRRMILEGTDNTPAYMDGQRTVSPAFKEAWNYLLQQDPKHPLSMEIKQILSDSQ
jgi:hypothetical protein